VTVTLAAEAIAATRLSTKTAFVIETPILTVNVTSIVTKSREVGSVKTYTHLIPVLLNGLHAKAREHSIH
jgi:7-cyano-7-deazaguanine synthase in queuosine biosynthesis